MIYSYPAGLPSFIKASKSRSIIPSFAVTEPRRGTPFVQKTGDDVPVLWDVSFTFSPEDQIRFIVWYKYTLDGGANQFYLDIDSEFGPVQQACQFLPDSLMDMNENGVVRGYKATIMARKLAVPASFEIAASIIVAKPDWRIYASTLDRVINQEWPGNG